MEVELPEQLRRQLDQAAEIERQIAAPTPTPAPLWEGNTGEPAPNPVEPDPAEQPALAEPQAPVATPVKESDPWEQKFHVLRGKYEAEVPRLHAQVKELSQQLSDLLTRKSAKEPPPDAAPKLVTDNDVETFGPDLVDMMRRAARDEMRALAGTVDQKVEERVKPVQEKLAQTESDRFWTTVDAAVPDFAHIDQDPRWIQYLDTRIPGTRATYRKAAEEAVRSNDAPALVEMVQLWKHLHAPPAPPAAAPSAPPASAELQRQVAPAARKAAAPPNREPQVYTGRDYEYWHDHRRSFDTDPTELARMKGELESAHSSGRIRW